MGNLVQYPGFGTGGSGGGSVTTHLFTDDDIDNDGMLMITHGQNAKAMAVAIEDPTAMVTRADFENINEDQLIIQNLFGIGMGDYTCYIHHLI